MPGDKELVTTKAKKKKKKKKKKDESAKKWAVETGREGEGGNRSRANCELRIPPKHLAERIPHPPPSSLPQEDKIHRKMETIFIFFVCGGEEGWSGEFFLFLVQDGPSPLRESGGIRTGVVCIIGKQTCRGGGEAAY